ncbi:MAG: helix-turn-helix transcriptional regulator [Acidimicrobiales bacterium]
MSKKKLVPATEVLAKDLEDETFRDEWEQTAFARQVALAVVKYRAEHGLSQAALARQLGVSQPVVARLELGEHTPTWTTLARISRETGLHFVVDVNPRDGAHLREVS